MEDIKFDFYIQLPSSNDWMLNWHHYSTSSCNSTSRPPSLMKMTLQNTWTSPPASVDVQASLRRMNVSILIVLIFIPAEKHLVANLSCAHWQLPPNELTGSMHLQILANWSYICQSWYCFQPSCVCQSCP